MFDPGFIPQSKQRNPLKDDDSTQATPSVATNVSLATLLRPSPWLLVSSGSYNGYFDWVDVQYRVGPWSIWSIVSLQVILSGLLCYKPMSIDFCTSAYPPAYTTYWYYNVVASCWMVYVLGRNIRQEGWAVPYTTFTVWSWTMLLLRHALSALAPLFVSANGDDTVQTGYLYFIIWLAEYLRCPSLLNAVVVFVVWNLILAPGIYVTMETKEKRGQFVRWLFQFNLLNQHGLVLPLAFTSAIVSAPRSFTDVDLWSGLATVVAYLLFYLLVLDRLGVHLYPIFSPRPRYCSLIWLAVAMGYYGLFRWMQHIAMPYTNEC